MKSRIILIFAVSLFVIPILWLADPVTAVTDTPMRKNLEFHGFNERLIRCTLYPKSTHDVYQPEKREYINGLRRITKDLIYEPDKYTWELAMAAHRRQIAELTSLPLPPPGAVQPVPMEPYAPIPTPPGQIQLTPLGTPQPNWELPPEADQKMQNLLSRARSIGVGPGGQLRGASIKQRLLEHLDSLNQSGPNPTFGPNPPVLPPPRGKAGDSYDRGF